MKKKNVLLKTVVLVAIFGPVTLLWLGAIYAALPPRDVAIGMLVWLAMLLLFAEYRKHASKKNLTSGSEPIIALDDRAHKSISREIWTSKIWIGVLVAALLIGVVNGVSDRAWVPTLGGIAIGVLLIYGAIREIRQRRKRINLTRP